MSERSTEERSFFNLRYAFPGYTFILLNVLVNLRILLFFFLTYMPKIGLSDTATTLLGILFGFFTLMSAAPIGFLVSQCWYVMRENILGGDCRRCRPSKPYRVLRDEFEVRGEKENLETVYNYIVHSCPISGVHSYLNRRWDLCMLFGSIGTAIVLGLGSAYITRGFIVKVPKSQQTFVNWPIYDWTIFIVSFLLLVLLFFGFRKIRQDHQSMCTFLIKLTAKKKELRDELPEQYFKEHSNP